MNDFRGAVDTLFPFEWKNDFQSDLAAKLAQYIEILRQFEDYRLMADDIETTCNTLNKIVAACYDGRRGEAFNLFQKMMNDNGEQKDLSSNIGTIQIVNGSYYYRARGREIGKKFTTLDMFHIPLNKRGIVKTQRYSSPGYPCLYLGNTVYSCWEELGRPIFDNLMFSAYRVRNEFKAFDLRIPSDDDYTEKDLLKTMNRIPLVLACSAKVKESSDVFKPEYIIPQLFVENIICNNKGRNVLDSNIVYGVIYTSTHINDDFPYDISYLENLAIPVVQSNNKNNYCEYLASLFDISKALCNEYESMKDNISRNLWSVLDDVKSRDEILAEMYEESKMGYLESKLKETEYHTLNHLLLGLAEDKTIHIDSNGKGKNVEIRTNQSFTIE